MCYKYYVSKDLSLRVAEDLALSLEEMPQSQPDHDVGVTQPALVVRAREASGESTGLRPDVMRFGFPGPSHRGIVANARQETVFQRAMFRDSIRMRRCVVPASAFYEWDFSKKRVTFRRPDSGVMYLAGFYDIRDGTSCFVLLTTAPNRSMEGIHDRMPLLVEKDLVPAWILEDARTEDLKTAAMPELVTARSGGSYEQLHL